MKKTKLLLLTIAIIASFNLTAQVAVNSDGSSADASAMLDVKSSNKGILIPRVSQTELEAINNPANGLMVFNTDEGKLFIYIASEFKWKEVQFGSGEILYPASLSIGTGGSCSNTTVNGNYIAGCDLDNSHNVVIDATVSSAGSWSIQTDTINGYSFSGSGIVSSTGTVQLTLYGNGTPLTNQTDTFTATVDLGGNSSCTFDVTVIILNCDDGNACTDDSFDTATCSCVHSPVVCDDNNACTDDSCDPQNGCEHIQVNCDDGNPCTDDICDPATGCQNILIDCDDGDPCTNDACDPATGNCTHTPVNCDDNDACTDDSCNPSTGQCQHIAIDCDDGDPNTTDSCDPVTGCVHTPIGPVNKTTNQRKDKKKK